MRQRLVLSGLDQWRAMNDQPAGLTILGSCATGPWLIADNVRCWEWETYPRREPKPARERLGLLQRVPINWANWP
jgi:hypothetical protein